MKASFDLAQLLYLAPLLSVASWACLVLLAATLGRGRSWRLGPLTVAALLVSLAVTLWSWGRTEVAATELLGGMALSDRFALFLDALFIGAALLTTTISSAFIEEHRFVEEEYYAVLLLALCGMMMMVHASGFVMLVIGLETMSLAIYALVASWSGRVLSAEAGIKYFVMGAVASAVLLYGVALLYGVSGSLSFGGIALAADNTAGNPLALLGMLLVIGALAFKVAVVPFHMWVPDSYEGAPTPVTGLMAAAVKAAGFGVLLRVATSVFGAEAFVFGSTGWGTIFWTLAALTMTLGNLAALRQHNIKRMLAYSSISHAGYLLIGVITVGVAPGSMGAVLFYLLAYAATTLGALGIVAWIGSRDAERLTLDDWAGLATRHPTVALLMALFMLSLAGIPPTGGFFAKLYLFRAALEHPQLLLLVIIAVLNSVISVYYYLRPVVAMYFRGPGVALQPLARPGVYFALGASALVVLLLGLLPEASLQWATQAVAAGLGSG